jgi:hypothetical protein
MLAGHFACCERTLTDAPRHFQHNQAKAMIFWANFAARWFVQKAETTASKTTSSAYSKTPAVRASCAGLEKNH